MLVTEHGTETGRGHLPVAHAQHRPYGREDKRGIGQWTQIDEPDAIGQFASRSAATCCARRVLPTPPGPVTVNSRAPAVPSSCTMVTTSSRPMSAVGVGER